ncbi:unnamed protein product [Durusdinium trenchii]|uniref:Uncharacterized protein n=2 Tax=Durusdinium trenchii TaxID=1381693 RepID=A0ABP0KDW6_9DINO
MAKLLASVAALGCALCACEVLRTTCNGLRSCAFSLHLLPHWRSRSAMRAEKTSKQKLPRWLSELQDEGLMEEKPDPNMCILLACDAAKRSDLPAAEQWLRTAASFAPAAPEAAANLWQVIGQCVPLPVAERWLSILHNASSGASLPPGAAEALLRAAARGCNLEGAERWFQAFQQQEDQNATVDQSLCLRLLSCSLQSGNTSMAEQWIKRVVQAGANASEITMRMMKDSAARRAYEAVIRQKAEAKDLVAARTWYEPWQG